jgi:hypothetical protein
VCGAGHVNFQIFRRHAQQPRSQPASKPHCKARICPGILTRDRKSATVKDVHYRWRKKEAQTDPVLMEGEAISQVYEFKYLGYLFTADNDQLPNVEQRIGRADAVFRSLQHIWQSNKLPSALKRRLYAGSVVSVLTYGHETWQLTEVTQRKLNNFNARCLASIYIGHRNTEPAERAQLIKEFCTPIGTVSQSGTVGRSTFNLIAHLRAWRLRWF